MNFADEKSPKNVSTLLELLAFFFNAVSLCPPYDGKYKMIHIKKDYEIIMMNCGIKHFTRYEENFHKKIFWRVENVNVQ